MRFFDEIAELEKLTVNISWAALFSYCKELSGSVISVHELQKVWLHKKNAHGFISKVEIQPVIRSMSWISDQFLFLDIYSSQRYKWQRIRHSPPLFYLANYAHCFLWNGSNELSRVNWLFFNTKKLQMVWKNMQQKHFSGT